MAWHPSKPNTLAVASNEFDIHLWTFDDKLGTEENENPIHTRADQILVGHKLRVIQLTWSPYDDRKLLSVSYDGTAQVWDTIESTGLANFRGHNGRLFCGLYSPNSDNPDEILTGGDDSMVYGWNVKDQPEKMPIKKNTKAPRSYEKRAALVHEKTESKDEENLPNKPIDLENSQKDPKNRKVNKKSYFGSSLTQENASRNSTYEDIEILLSKSKIDVTDKPHLAFFAQNNDINDLVTHELQNCDKNDSFNLALWGSKSKTIKELLEAQIGHLTDWHISLAAACQDHQTWKWACSMYAKQLEEKGLAVKAASYYLMISEIALAMQVLGNANFYHAALVIAKARLPPEHPMITDFYRQWAHKSHEDGLYGVEAKCWVAINDLEKAAAALARSGDGQSLRVASEMIASTGDTEKARVLGFQAMEAFKVANDSEGLNLLAKNTEVEEIKSKILANEENASV